MRTWVQRTCRGVRAESNVPLIQQISSKKLMVRRVDLLMQSKASTRNKSMGEEDENRGREVRTWKEGRRGNENEPTTRVRLICGWEKTHATQSPVSVRGLRCTYRKLARMISTTSGLRYSLSRPSPIDCTVSQKLSSHV